MSGCQVFVTVGTTSFDELVQEIIQPEIIEVLEAKGYKHMMLQIGKSQLNSQIPQKIVGMTVDYYRLKPNISDDFARSSLVISHAGAGCCLEALSMKKDLIIVINEKLMGNHQVELATKLSESGHAITCTPKTLLETLRPKNDVELHPCCTLFNEHNYTHILSKIDKI
nr:EOG090X0KOU [Eulimnadia texana]